MDSRSHAVLPVSVATGTSFDASETPLPVQREMPA